MPYSEKLHIAEQNIEANPLLSFQLANEVLKETNLGISDTCMCYQIIAHYWKTQNEYDKADDFLFKAYNLLIEVEDYDYEKAFLSMNIGIFLSEVHQYEDALAYFEEAIEVFMLLEVWQLGVTVLSHKADTLIILRNYEEAENDLQQARKISENHEDFIHISQQLGDFYFLQDKLKEAEKLYLEALQSAKTNQVLLTSAYAAVIKFYAETKRPNTAMNLLRETTQYEESKSSLVLNYVAFELLIHFGFYDDAEGLFRRVKRLTKSKKQTDDLVYFYATSLEMFKALGGYCEGCKSYKKALNILEKDNLFQQKWLLHNRFGWFLEEFNKPKKRIKIYRKATKELEGFRQSVPDGFDRIHFFADKVEYLHNYVCIALEYNYLKDAFYFLEASKSKTLIDVLSTKKLMKSLSYKKIKQLL
ncbi:MAG: tetratricopeptide repeat protein [Chitinophagales bacterium]